MNEPVHAKPYQDALGALRALDALVADVTTGDPADAVLDLLNAAEDLAAKARALKSMADDMMLGWLQENGGSLTVGEIRYYVGRKKTTRLLYADKLLERLLTETGGDLEAVSMTLSANAFKPASVRGVIGEAAMPEFFEETVVNDLLTGKPLKELKKTNEKFANLAKSRAAKNAPKGEGEANGQ